MSNIKNAFKNKKAFIAFFTCGDPDLETTKKAIRSAEKYEQRFKESFTNWNSGRDRGSDRDPSFGFFFG